ncbi:peptidoglycan D,D-transpeptidase FtsI family protein [Anaeromicropila herbilytica]|uniref:Stage V sporulation protein D n=1 Tax=Anaeromicropila herbilytica TaxID=2785025 RepID=A0A7R7EME9_9FIRM|nr:penicillin-binding protein 2 [Anaeromicropila herbilytica]BCN31556.1 stage V sporulation protein D [Anaeromicropila herbilytica]
MRKITKASKIKKFTPKMQASLLLVFCIMILLLVVLIGRLVYLNTKDGEKYEKRVLSQQTYVSSVIPYQRGKILDRNGTELATNEKVYNLVLDPKTMLSKEDYRNPTEKALTESFDISKEELDDILSKKASSQYVVVRKELSYDQVTVFNKKVKADKKKLIKGVWFEEEYKRIYPYNSLASHVLGFTRSGNVGTWGLEEYYNSQLNGYNGREYGYFDSKLKLERNVKEATNGNTLVTTLDTNIQNLVEKHINKFQKDIGSKRTSVLVMNPNNGEIYAMASSGEFDLNNPTNLEKFYTKSQIAKMSDKKKSEALSSIWRNTMISNAYEPGSTFKPMTVSAGLEEGKLTGNEIFHCPGYKMVGGRRIKCSHVHGTITLKEAIMHSCNVALMEIAKKEGKNIFTNYQQLFGMGEKTGIDLPGETSGLLYKLKDMGTVDLATNSFGQNFSVNMLQIASAFSSIVNGGHLYQPHLVKQIVNDKGATVKNIGATLLKETVSQKTSETMKDYLYATVEDGTATGAQVKGVQVGGKTGTAEKIPRGSGTYLVSFIGAAPAYDPEVVIYVTIDELNQDRQDQSGFATKLAGEILKDIIPFLGISQDTGNSKGKVDSNTNTNAVNNSSNDDKKEVSNSLTNGKNGKTSNDSNSTGSNKNNVEEETYGETSGGDVPESNGKLGQTEDTNQGESNKDSVNQ